MPSPILCVGRKYGSIGSFASAESGAAPSSLASTEPHGELIPNGSARSAAEHPTSGNNRPSSGEASLKPRATDNHRRTSSEVQMS
eukprot:1196255-Prorocentrum_minimum.AAC.3